MIFPQLSFFLRAYFSTKIQNSPYDLNWSECVRSWADELTGRPKRLELTPVLRDDPPQHVVALLDDLLESTEAVRAQLGL